MADVRKGWTRKVEVKLDVILLPIPNVSLAGVHDLARLEVEGACVYVYFSPTTYFFFSPHIRTTTLLIWMGTLPCCSIPTARGNRVSCLAYEVSCRRVGYARARWAVYNDTEITRLRF